MRYALTKKIMMEAYPRLFVDESDVLHHLFAVGGNGYEWIDGELTTGQTAEEFLSEAKQDAVSLGETIEKPVTARRKEKLWRQEMASRRLYGQCYFLRKDGTVGRILYPLSEYADLLNIPDDVKPDWLNAAARAVVLFRKAFRTTPKDRALLKKAAKIIECKRAAF